MTERIAGFRGIFALPDMAATASLAARIAAGLRTGDCIALKGDLGTGKTTLTRAILRALGVAEHVPSPTFTLVQSYETPKGQVFHFDLYRVKDTRELDELGFDEALDQGIVIVEWPERTEERLPENTLTVELSMTGNNGRSAAISGDSYWNSHLSQEESHARP